MLRKLILAMSLLLMGTATASAQFYPTQYRPPVDWQQLTTEHFKVVFPQGEDSAAWQTARILETEYPKVQQLTGGALSNFPVILTNYNDRSNGLVTSLHFRSEIDIPPIQGKTLNPETGGWLQNVVPHELVHALQFNNMGGFGLGQLVNTFSPDLARSMHGASPSGIQEGLATYYESEFIVPGGGRGNYPFFSNQFNAVFNSPDWWSMGQMVHFPADTRPFNRHYIGGYEFTNWLQNTYGSNTSRDAIDFHIRWPFLGYGTALKHATGLWPSQLFNDFEADKKQSIQSDNLKYKPLPLDFDGSDIRRPKWLSDSTLVFHGSFYNAEQGFYRYNLHNQTAERLIKTGSVSDYNYALSRDRKFLIYSYYQPDVIYPNAFNATLVQRSWSDGGHETISPDGRLFSPSLSTDSTLLALKTQHANNKLVELELTNHTVNPIYTDSSSQLISAVAYPQNDSLAIVMNQRGTQGLWLTSRNSMSKDLKRSPSISFRGGSIFDPVWHPSGDRLLFSADFSGALQVYEYTQSTGIISQLTNASYNAFEASYSPDGDRIAFVVQRGNERLPVILSRKEFYGKTIPANTGHPQNVTNQPVNNTDDWKTSSYSTGLSWLKPRSVLPIIEEVTGSDEVYELGVGFHSSDLLQQQAYSLNLTTTNERLWYNLSYRNKQFFPGFKAQVYSKPALSRFRFITQQDDTLAQNFLRQERSFALSVPMRFTLHQNVDVTSLYVEPEMRQSQLRYFNQDADERTRFSNATVGNIFAQFNYKLQQNIRDVQPSSGLVLYSEVEHFFSSDSLQLPVANSNATLNFNKPTALRAGIYGYLAPFKQWNQSLRIGLEGITQTSRAFDNQSIVSNGFSDAVLPFANNLLSFNTRYTIPLFYPDNGGLLIPLYLSNVYLTGFTNTVADPASNDIINASRTVIGGGLRVQFRISNLSFDIGAGIGVEPSRNKIHYFIGSF